jgi:hypothetical protein
MGADEQTLAAQLERHNATLLDVPGVTGTAVGLGTRGEPAIHVYAASEDAVPQVRAEAEQLLGDVPIEVITIGIPEAQERN